MESKLEQIEKEIEELEKSLNKLEDKRDRIERKIHNKNNKKLLGKYLQENKYFFHPVEIKDGLFWGVRIFKNNREPVIEYSHEIVTIWGTSHWKEITKEKFYAEMDKALAKFGVKRK